MKKYIVALVCSAVGFSILGAVGYYIFISQPSALTPAMSDNMRVAAFILGALVWSGMQILAVLSLIGVEVFPFIQPKKTDH